MYYERNPKTMRGRRQSLRIFQTEAEAKLWYRLRGKRLMGLKFLRQYGIGPYVLDFFCCAKNLAIEVDGSQHGSEDAKGYDQTRSDYLKANGIEVIRFWNNEVLGNIEGVLEKIMNELALHSPPTPPSVGRGEVRNLPY